MIPLQTLLPDLAARETRSVIVGPGPGIPAGEYAFLEFRCEDIACDCRRVFLQVVGRAQPNRVLASINFGWEKEEFYRAKMPYDPDAPREITRGSLDPLNTQSKYAADFLSLFQEHVLDEPYRIRLKRHYQSFKQAVKKTGSKP